MDTVRIKKAKNLINNKAVLLIAVLAMILALAACSQPIEELIIKTPPATPSPEVTTPADSCKQVIVQKSGLSKAVSVQGLDSIGQVIWTRNWILKNEWDYIGFSDALLREKIVYLVADHHLTALDSENGDTIWINRNFDCSSCTPVVDNDTIYTGGYYSSFAGFSIEDGTFMFSTPSLDGDFYSPHKLELRDNNIIIYFLCGAAEKECDGEEDEGDGEYEGEDDEYEEEVEEGYAIFDLEGNLLSVFAGERCEKILINYEDDSITVRGINSAGTALWARNFDIVDESEYTAYSYAAIIKGVAYLQINYCMAALNFEDGSTIWMNEKDEGAYCTPILRGTTVYSCDYEASCLTGFSTKNGKRLFETPASDDFFGAYDLEFSGDNIHVYYEYAYEDYSGTALFDTKGKLISVTVGDPCEKVVFVCNDDEFITIHGLDSESELLWSRTFTIADDWEDNGNSRASVNNGVAYLQMNYYMMALDFATGETIWRNEDAKGEYCTPIVYGDTIYAGDLETSFLSGFSVIDGALLFKTPAGKHCSGGYELEFVGDKILVHFWQINEEDDEGTALFDLKGKLLSTEVID